MKLRNSDTEMVSLGALVSKLSPVPLYQLETIQVTGGEGNGTPLQYSCLGKIPQTEEPCRLQSIVSQRVGLSDFTFSFHFHALEKEMGQVRDWGLASRP